MESISVSVRLRPLNKREITLKQTERWKSIDNIFIRPYLFWASMVKGVACLVKDKMETAI